MGNRNRWLPGLLMVAMLAVVGVYTYNLGVAQGLAESGKLVAARSFSADAASRRVALEVDAPDGLPPIEIDPVRIREVIGNLLSNALRHTPDDGSVHVRISESQTPNPESRLVVEVRDTGSGMTPNELAHAFDRFYKGSKSRGSGLGLTIARNLVTAHGGEIHASSEPGAGATITFTLPRDVGYPS